MRTHLSAKKKKQMGTSKSRFLQSQVQGEGAVTVTFETTSGAQVIETDFILIGFTDRAAGFVSGTLSHGW